MTTERRSHITQRKEIPLSVNGLGDKLPTFDQALAYTASVWRTFWEGRQDRRAVDARIATIRAFHDALKNHSEEGKALLEKLQIPDSRGKSPLARIPDDMRHLVQEEKEKKSKSYARAERRRKAAARRGTDPKTIH